MLSQKQNRSRSTSLEKPSRQRSKTGVKTRVGKLNVAFRKNMTPKAPSTSSKKGWVFTRIVPVVQETTDATSHTTVVWLMGHRTPTTNNTTMTSLAKD